MRTWRQGIIGEIKISKLESLYVHCLKFPLAKVYAEYDVNDQVLSKYLFSALLDLSVLKSIDRVGDKKLSRSEKSDGDAFSYDSRENKILMGKGPLENEEEMKRLYTLDEIAGKFHLEKGRERKA